MSTEILFLTAQNIDTQGINKILKHLYFMSDCDHFHVVTKRLPEDAIPEQVEATSWENDTFSDANPFSDSINEWVGASYKDVEAFVLEVQATNDAGEPEAFLVLDEQGMNNGTMIFAISLDDSETTELPYKFKKIRQLSWRAAATMCVCATLGIGPTFDEQCEDEGDEHGWFKPKKLD